MESIEVGDILYCYRYKPYGGEFITAEWWRSGDKTKHQLDCGFRTEQEVDRQVEREIYEHQRNAT
jgi:hypothetical protein